MLNEGDEEEEIVKVTARVDSEEKKLGENLLDTEKADTI